MLDSSPFDARLQYERTRPSAPESDGLSLKAVLAVLRRRILLLVASIAVALALGLAFLSVAPSRYLATAQLLMDTRRSDQPGAQYVVVDPSAVESQVETIRSQRIALAVIDKLGLANDPEFNRRGILTRILATLRLGDIDRPLSSEEQLRRTVVLFRDQLTVNRVGPSYIANVAFLSIDPEKAAAIANEVVDAYIEDQLSARVLNVERSNSWIQKRVAELRQQADNSTFALEDFKAKSISRVHEDDYRTKLGELTATAQAATRAYDTFQSLVRYVQSSGERMFPVTDARILAQASPPLSPTSPNRVLVLILSLAVGAALGTAAAIAWELLDIRIRRPDQIEQNLQIKAFGFLPFVGGSSATASSAARDGAPAREPLLRFTDCDGSPVSDILIAVQLAVDAADSTNMRGNIVGITSARVGEGKTTVAFNLALSMIGAGKKVLLVDCNLRNASLTRALAPDCEPSLDDFSNSRPLLDAAAAHHPSGVAFLPIDGWTGHPANTLRSAKLHASLQKASQQYDYILVDLPSALDYVDVQACATSFGSLLFVADFGRSTVPDLKRLLETGAVAERVLGVVLTRTNRKDDIRFRKQRVSSQMPWGA